MHSNGKQWLQKAAGSIVLRKQSSCGILGNCPYKSKQKWKSICHM